MLFSLLATEENSALKILLALRNSDIQSQKEGGKSWLFLMSQMCLTPLRVAIGSLKAGSRMDIVIGRALSDNRVMVTC